MSVWTIRATLWTKAWYDREGQPASSVESHFKTTMKGSIHDNREKLAKRAIRIFQKMILDRYGKRLERKDIKVRYEREEAALASSPEIHVESREMKYRGKRVEARSLPTMTLRWRHRRRHQMFR